MRCSGPLGHIAKMRVASLGGRRRLVVAEMLESGTVKPVVDRRDDRPADIPDALACLGEGHACGKIVVSAPVQADEQRDA